MPKLPAVKPRQLISILNLLGFHLDRSKGSHHIFIHPDGRNVIVAVHSNKEIPKGTLISIFKDLEISKEEFVKLLKKK